MIIFRSGKKDYPIIPTWVMKKNKLKDEHEVIIENCDGDIVKLSRDKLCDFLSNDTELVKRTDTGLEYFSLDDVKSCVV